MADPSVSATNRGEADLKVTRQMLACRDAARALFGDGYEAAIAPWVSSLTKVTAHTGRPLLSIALEVAKTIEPEALLLMFAAVVEMLRTENKS